MWFRLFVGFLLPISILCILGLGAWSSRPGLEILEAVVLAPFAFLVVVAALYAHLFYRARRRFNAAIADIANAKTRPLPPKGSLG
jgi:hypothetical protein